MRSGFTILRNGSKLGYPFRESLRSLAPFVDEIVVAHGDSDDDTGAELEALNQELDGKLKIFSSPWDAESRRAGLELSRQTNVALEHCRGEVCFYLQSDEVLQLDAEREVLLEDLARFEVDDAVDALALRWLHFYGNFDTIVESRRWYRREVRVFKKRAGLRSFGDAQGFRIPPAGDLAGDPKTWTKPRAALSRAHVLHYGWVRPPETMARKSRALDQLWGHADASRSSHFADSVYSPQFGLKPYTGVHPAIMSERVEALRGYAPLAGRAARFDKAYVRGITTAWIEALTDWRPGEYKNYRLLKKY